MATTIEVKEPISSPSLSPPPPPPPSYNLVKLFLLLNAILMLIGGAAPLLLRLYFLHHGRRLWLSSLLQVCGWPILLLPILFSSKPKHHLSLPLFLIFFLLGLFTAITCYLYAFSSFYLPLSTSSLLASTQLAFTAFFAFLLVKQRFTPYSFNAVVLLTFGPVVLSLRGSDKLSGEAASKYYLAFFMSLAASALGGLSLPLMELAMRRSRSKVTYGMVMEMQVVMGVAGTLFCLVGMAIKGDFKVIAREAKEFELGEMKYYMVLIWDAILWQLLTLGLVGLIYTSVSALLAGVMVGVLLPVAEILAVIFLHEKFDGGKAVALFLSLWGFFSYLYGERKRSRKLKQKALDMDVMELPTNSTPSDQLN